jgi:hypothetical protein
VEGAGPSAPLSQPSAAFDYVGAKRPAHCEKVASPYSGAFFIERKENVACPPNFRILMTDQEASHCGDRNSVIVMESALQDQKTLALNLIDEAMLLSDPSGPPTFQIFFEWLRLTDSRKWIPRGIPDEFVYSLEDFTVILLPVKVVFPTVREPA